MDPSNEEDEVKAFVTERVCRRAQTIQRAGYQHDIKGNFPGMLRDTSMH